LKRENSRLRGHFQLLSAGTCRRNSKDVPRPGNSGGRTGRETGRRGKEVHVQDGDKGERTGDEWEP